MFENIRNAIIRQTMDRLHLTCVVVYPSCSLHVRHVAAAMATAVAQQQHIEYSAVMGI